MRAGAGVRSATVVVGREVELDLLTRAVRSAGTGRPSCIVLVGEGGVGKSRLLAETDTLARQVGVSVISARAALAAPAPFSLLSEGLRSWLRGHPTAPFGSPLDDGLRIVLPEWSPPRPGHVGDLDSAQLRLLAFEGIVRLLHGVVQDGPGAVLMVDDLHAADPDSLEALRYVASAQVAGLAVVGALRPGESGLADDLVRRARTDPAAYVVELENLDQRAVAELVSNLLDAAVPAELVDDIAARTDGVPLLIEEVIDAYLRTKSLTVAAGTAFWVGGPTVVPRSVRGMVEGRLERLPAPARDVVLATAVVARPESVPVIAEVARVDETTVNEAFRDGIDAGLFATRAGVLGFRHDLIREAVLDAAVPQIVTAMHRRAAAALSSEHAARRAAHLAAAGDDDAAARAFAAAALVDVAAHALLSAEGLARRAVNLAEASDSRAGAADALAATLSAQGRWAEALNIDASTVAEHGGNPDRRARMATSALEAGFADQARAVLVDAADPTALDRVLAGRVALVQGDAATALREARAVLADPIDIAARLAALDLQGRALDFLDDREQAQRSWAAQAEEAQAAGRTGAELRALLQLGKQEFFTGHPPARLREAVGLAARAGALVELAWAEELLSAALVLQGDPGSALKILDDAVPRARELRLDQLGFLLAGQAGARSFFTDDSVESLLEEAERVAPAPELRMFTTSMRADIAIRNGRYDEAATHYRVASEMVQAMPGVAPMSAPCWLAWALAAVGQHDEAEAACARAQTMPDLARWHPRPVIVNAGRFLLAGDADGIDAALSNARGPMPFDIAVMRVIAAEVLGGDNAAGWLRDALDTYDRAGATAHQDRVRRLLRAAGGPVPRRRRAAAIPEALANRGVTAREAEVLDLLAQGLSNAEIAAKLFLSVRTVETYVSSLLAKFGARSRAQLATRGTPPVDS